MFLSFQSNIIQDQPFKYSVKRKSKFKTQIKPAYQILSEKQPTSTITTLSQANDLKYRIALQLLFTGKVSYRNISNTHKTHRKVSLENRRQTAVFNLLENVAADDFQACRHTFNMNLWFN